MIERMRAWWAARAPRERAVLGVGGAALALAALWAYVWVPIAEDRARLAAALPGLRAQAAALALEAAEVERLRTAARGRGAASPAAIEDALKAAGFGAAFTGVAPLGEGRVQVNLRAVPFDELARALAALGERQGVAVESLALRAAGDGRVQVESLVLRTARGG